MLRILLLELERFKSSARIMVVPKGPKKIQNIYRILYQDDPLDPSALDPYVGAGEGSGALQGFWGSKVVLKSSKISIGSCIYMLRGIQVLRIHLQEVGKVQKLYKDYGGPKGSGILYLDDPWDPSAPDPPAGAGEGAWNSARSMGSQGGLKRSKI